MKVKEESIIMPLPDDELIQSFEEYHEVELPEDYKEFLKKYSGAIPEERNFKNKKGYTFVVERFLCLLEGPIKDQKNGEYDIGVVITQLDDRIVVDEDATGSCVIPIAALFSGNFLCLDFRKRKVPSVAVWLHEESEEFEPVLVKVAKDFTQFINMLS